MRWSEQYSNVGVNRRYKRRRKPQARSAERRRDAVLLRLKGVPVKEIAWLLDLSLSTVGGYLSRVGYTESYGRRGRFILRDYHANQLAFDEAQWRVIAEHCEYLHTGILRAWRGRSEVDRKAESSDNLM